MEFKPEQKDLKSITDPRGSLLPIEASRDIPFPILRVYFITDVPGNLRRGAHAHHKTVQAIFCIRGSCKMHFDDGKTKSSVLIDSTKVTLIDKLVWHEMDEFTPDCVAVVFADQYYDKSDYIVSHDEFLRITR